MTVSIETLTAALNQKNIRPSYQRIKVLEYLREHGGHPTADEIYQALAPLIPSLSKATIYNTLHTFAEVGLVRVVNIEGDETRYDDMLDSHGHFQCENCGAIYNFSIDIDHFPFAGLEHFEIHHKDVYFKGICSKCNR